MARTNQINGLADLKNCCKQTIHFCDKLNTSTSVKTCSEANRLKEVRAQRKQHENTMLRSSGGNPSSLPLGHWFPGRVGGIVTQHNAKVFDWVTESYLFAFLQQQLQSVVGSFGHHFIPLRFILTLGVVHVDAEVECYIHQGCHQLHGCQKHKHHWEIQSNPPTAIATGLVDNKRLRKVTRCENKIQQLETFTWFVCYFYNHCIFFFFFFTKTHTI